MASRLVASGLAAATRLALVSLLSVMVISAQDVGTPDALKLVDNGTVSLPSSISAHSFLASDPESGGRGKGGSLFRRLRRRRSPSPGRQDEARALLSQRVAEATSRMEALRAERARRDEERRRRQSAAPPAAPPVAPAPPPVSTSDDIKRCLQVLQTRLPRDEAYFCVTGREESCRATMRSVLRDGHFKSMRLAVLKALLEQNGRRLQVSFLLLNPENVRQLALLAPFMVDPLVCGGTFDEVDVLNSALQDVSGTIASNKEFYNAAMSFGKEQGESMQRLRRLIQTDIVRVKAALERLNEVASFVMFSFVSKVNEFSLLARMVNFACRVAPLCRAVIRQVIEQTLELPSVELLRARRSSPRLLADVKEYVSLLLNREYRRLGDQFSELLAAYLTAVLERHLSSLPA